MKLIILLVRTDLLVVTLLKNEAPSYACPKEMKCLVCMSHSSQLSYCVWFSYCDDVLWDGVDGERKLNQILFYWYISLGVYSYVYACMGQSINTDFSKFVSDWILWPNNVF